MITYDDEDYTGSAQILYCVEENLQYPDYYDQNLYIHEDLYGFPITKICDGAFSNCQSLMAINLPTTIDTIGVGAFVNLSNLQSVQFYRPSFIESAPSLCISERAFANCSSLHFLDTPESLEVSGLKDCAFLNCTSLADLMFLSGSSPLDSIGNGCFAGCSSLGWISLPNSLTYIGEGAFLYCTSLQSISIPSEVTEIGKYAFAECSGLTTVTLNNRIETINEATFLKCIKLRSITIPNSVTTIGNYAFTACRELIRATLSNNLTTIGDRAFSGCYALTNLNIPNSVTTIGNYAFLGGRVGIEAWRPSTSGIDLSIAVMEEALAYDMGSLKTITFGSNVNSIGAHSFVGHIPESITCMASTPPALLTGIFTYHDVFDELAYDSTMLYVPKVLVNAYREADGWKKFVNINGIEVFGNGDANGDGETNVSDVVNLINALLNDDPTGINAVNADINGDGEVNVTDIIDIINLLLNNE